MTSIETNEILRRVHQHVPLFEKLLAEKLQAELSGLPSANSDKVQILQGRCLAMQEILAELRFAAGITADRTAKPKP